MFTGSGSPIASDFYAAALIAVGFVSLIVAAEAWRAFKNPPREWTRKLVHFGGGMLCLCLPFFIRSHWVVLALAASMAVIFIVSKRKGWLTSIHGVDRASSGTEYYPIVVYLLFLLCWGVAWKFVICVLVLAVADSAAALVGRRFGRVLFSIENEFKSVEGSAAFFAVTVAAVLIPLLVWNPLGEDSTAIWHYILAACLIGLLVMCVELISLRGSDNLWVPLGTLLVLTKTMQTDVFDLAIQNISFIGILVTVIAGSFVSRTFNVGGAIALCLASYSCWAMGSFDWALPVFLGFGVYIVVSYFAKSPWELRVKPVFFNLISPFLMLGAANILLNVGSQPGYQYLFVPFLAAINMSLTQGCANLASWKVRKQLRKRWALSAFLAVVIGVVLNVPAVYRGTLSWSGVVTIVIVVLCLVLASCKTIKSLPPGDAPKRWLYLRVGLTTLAFFVVLFLQYVGLCPVGAPA